MQPGNQCHTCMSGIMQVVKTTGFTGILPEPTEGQRIYNRNFQEWKEQKMDELSGTGFSI